VNEATIGPCSLPSLLGIKRNSGVAGGPRTLIEVVKTMWRETNGSGGGEVEFTRVEELEESVYETDSQTTYRDVLCKDSLP
jgi:hypothetical protein